MNSDTIGIEEFLTLSKHTPIIDVRSPSEFSKGHIPCAYNVPLFNDDERVMIGTLYKNSGKEAAMLAGLDIVGPKMSGFVKKAINLCKTKEALIHCWRGGMRSSSFAWLLNLHGIRSKVLMGGYSTFRKHVQLSFHSKIPIIILSGRTGSGKTAYLEQMQKSGEQVLDLEKIASHKGSAFGTIGMNQQPTNEQFENNLFLEWTHLDKEKTTWVEDESQWIGICRIPDALFVQMRQSPALRIEVEKSQRIKRLVDDYSGTDDALLFHAIEKIKKRLGGLNTQLCLEALSRKDYKTIADTTLVYYDKTYDFGLMKRNPESIHHLDILSDSIHEGAKAIREFANTLSGQ